MKKPDPQIGQIIKYDYLWRDEEQQGRDEGAKERPCAVVVASRKDENGESKVLLAPITHTPPHKGQAAIEIAGQAKPVTGLDSERSWLVLSEINMVQWSDPGIVPASKGQWLYGQLPRGVAVKAADNVKAGLKIGLTKVVDRTKAELSRGIWNRSSGDDRGR